MEDREVKHRKETGGIVIGELHIIKRGVAVDACVSVLKLDLKKTQHVQTSRRI